MVWGKQRLGPLPAAVLCLATVTGMGRIVAHQGGEWQVAAIAGFNSVAAGKDALLSENRGAELGLYLTTPWRLWCEHSTALALRAQSVAYPNAIETPSPTVASETVKLTNASHSQLRAEMRQTYALWDIPWTIGLGLMLPVSSSISTPRGELSYSEARATYTEASDQLRKIDQSYAVFLRFGIDQKLLDDALLLGLGFDFSALEFPRTEQRLGFNLYAGIRVW